MQYGDGMKKTLHNVQLTRLYGSLVKVAFTLDICDFLDIAMNKPTPNPNPNPNGDSNQSASLCREEAVKKSQKRGAKKQKRAPTEMGAWYKKLTRCIGVGKQPLTEVPHFSRLSYIGECVPFKRFEGDGGVKGLVIETNMDRIGNPMGPTLDYPMIV